MVSLTAGAADVRTAGIARGFDLVATPGTVRTAGIDVELHGRDRADRHRWRASRPGRPTCGPPPPPERAHAYSGELGTMRESARPGSPGTSNSARPGRSAGTVHVDLVTVGIARGART